MVLNEARSTTKPTSHSVTTPAASTGCWGWS